MRFLRLGLRPYGVFEGLDLCFDPRRGLHVIHGPNGAGKSTTLRALRAALYGMPPGEGAVGRESRELRLFAELERSSGERLAFTRRTARKSPLFDAEDLEPLAEERLAPFLGGLERQRFEVLFGLDLETLVAGGKDLLEGRGEVGRALFGAALGGRRLARVHERLAAETEGLFTPSASKPRINALCSDHAKLQKELRAAQRSVNAFEQERRRLAQLEQEREEADGRRLELDGQIRSLEARARAIVTLAGLEEREREREALGAQEPMDPARAESVLSRARELEGLRQRREDLERELRHLDDELAQHAAGAEALDDVAMAEVARLGQDLGRYRSSRDGLQEQRSAAEAARGRYEAALAASGARGDAEDDTPLVGDPRELFETSDRLSSTLVRAEEELRSHEKEFQRARVRLEQARTAVDGLGERLDRELALDLQRLAPFRGGVAQLADLAVPALDALEETEREHRRLEQEAEQAASRRAEGEESVRRLEQRLADLRGAAGQLPPTRSDVLAARAERDRVLSETLDRASAEPLAPATARDVEGLVRRADETVDALLDDAERAAERSAIEHQLEAARAELEAARDREQRAEEALRVVLEGHRDTWRGLGQEPASPAAMLSWARRRLDLLQKADELRRGAGRDVDEAEGALGQRRADLESARSTRDEARVAWTEWAAARGFDPQAGPEGAQRRLRELDEVAQARAELGRASSALERSEQEVRTFEAEAADLVQQLGIVVVSRATGADASSAVEERVAALLEAAEQRRSAATLLRSTQERHARRQEDMRRAKAQIEQLHAGLAEEAGGEEAIEDLLRAAQVAGQLGTLTRDIEDHLRRFEEDATGLSRAQVLALREEGETASAASQRLKARARSLADDLEQLQQLQRERGEEIASLRERLRGDGSDEAARIASDMARIEAELEEAAETYLQARLARTLLEREIERYRQRTQGPLLKRAQELFAILTLGAYEALLTEEDDRGRSVMVARRPDGRSVAVDHMSTGTCDQLYLALRIASVEHTLRTMEPMPFIADDLFVNFDDERTEAALRVLGQLAATTQVIVFSHHLSVVATCKRLGEEGVPVEVLELSGEAERERARVRQET